MISLVEMGHMEFLKSNPDLVLVTFSLLFYAGSLGHDLSWKLIFTKYVSCLLLTRGNEMKFRIQSAYVYICWWENISPPLFPEPAA